jgi:hypothetical protein
LLAVASEVSVPSQDVANRFSRWGRPGLISVAPHEPDPTGLAQRRVPWRQEEALRIVVIGAINQAKGYGVLQGLAEVVRQRQAPVELSLLGYSSNDAALSSSGVRLLGRYFDSELHDRIDAANPHLILVPSIWPETYCYVLSGALRSGRLVAVFDLGAQAERVRDCEGPHLVLPLALADDLNGLLDELLAVFAHDDLAATPIVPVRHT